MITQKSNDIEGLKIKKEQSYAWKSAKKVSAKFTLNS